MFFNVLQKSNTHKCFKSLFPSLVLFLIETTIDNSLLRQFVRAVVSGACNTKLELLSAFYKVSTGRGRQLITDVSEW